MKNQLLCKCLVLVSVFTTFQNFGQKAEHPDYRYEVGGSITGMTLTQGGTLIVSTANGLVGIKPEQNELLFSFSDYGKVKPEEIYYVPNAPYLVVSQGGFIGSKKTVYDYLSGKKLFSTEGNGWKAVMNCDVMIPQNKLVVFGQRRAEEKYSMDIGVYDLETGKEDFRFPISPKKVSLKSYVVTGRPLMLENTLIIPTSQGLVAKKCPSGETLWQNEVKSVSWLEAGEKDELYTFEISANGKNTMINKIGSGGQPIWDKEYKMKGVVSKFKITPKGLAVVSDEVDDGKGGLMKNMISGRAESNISFLDSESGKDLWEKAPKTKGFVQHFYIMDDGILFGIYEGGINKISYDGIPLFKKPLKTGENILTMADTPQGLIYITSEDANIVNLTTGEQVWDKPLKYKRADAVVSAYDEKHSRYLISAENELFSVEANSGKMSTLANAAFEGKESPSGMEIRDGGILLTSNQNMMMLGWEGGQAWHKYYQAPGKSAFGAILAATSALASAGMAAANYAKAQQHTYRLSNQLTERGKLYDQMGDAWAGAAAASVSEMLRRFKATAATENAQFILTKLDEGVGLVKLNKDTGALEKEIVLKDKKPVYEVDEIGGMLYYKADKSTVFAYELK